MTFYFLKYFLTFESKKLTKMSDFNFPKVLVAAPQHDSKRYCWEEWKERVKNLTYPNYTVYLADNSPTDDFYKEIKAEGFKCERVGYHLEGILARTTAAHDACRKYAMKHKYDFILHLETDVLPPLDVIETLLKSRKKVISGTYDIFHGQSRKSMIQVSEPLDRFKGAYRTVPFIEEDEPLFFDGEVKQVYHAGIGCTLISKKVFSEIQFRFNARSAFHADTWFANDCFQKDIPVFVDTSVQCKHLNQTWLEVADEILKPILDNNNPLTLIK